MPRRGRHDMEPVTGLFVLKRIDLTRTSYPKRTMDSKGNKVVTLGVTRDSVLALLILMKHLIELRWQELGDILQLYEMLTMELLTEEERMGVGGLRLVSFMDISTNVEKIKTAAKLCPDIVKLDLSMFNFSSYYENITQDNSLLGYGIEASSSAEGETEHSWVDQLFSFKHLKDLEAVFLDDSPAFLNNIR